MRTGLGTNSPLCKFNIARYPDVSSSVVARGPPLSLLAVDQDPEEVG